MWKWEKQEHVQLTKTRGVMNAIEQMAREKNYITAEKKIEDLSKQDNIKLFDLSYTDLLRKLFPVTEAGRIGEASISTLYDYIKPKKRGRKRGRGASEHVERSSRDREDIDPESNYTSTVSTVVPS